MTRPDQEALLKAIIATVVIMLALLFLMVMTNDANADTWDTSPATRGVNLDDIGACTKAFPVSEPCQGILMSYGMAMDCTLLKESRPLLIANYEAKLSAVKQMWVAVVAEKDKRIDALLKKPMPVSRWKKIWGRVEPVLWFAGGVVGGVLLGKIL